MAFDYYSPVTINAGQVPSAQADFPVLISVTDARFKTVANGGHVKNASGFDIRPYSDATLLTAITGYELERYNASTGEVIMWVKRSSVVDGLITYLAYGDLSLVTDGSSATTWSNGFLGVYHLADGTTLNLEDSVSGNLGTNSAIPVTATTGKIDGAGAFVTANSKFITGPNITTTVNTTISAWINATSFPSAYNCVSGYNTGSLTDIMLIKSNGKLALFTDHSNYDGTGTHTLLVGTTYYIVMTYNGNVNGLFGYVNGAVDNTTSAAGGPMNNGASTPFLVGKDALNGRFWNGWIDEARIASVARSAGWITTEYNNQSSPSTFETLGDEVSTTPIPTPTPEPVIIVPVDEHRGGARGWKKRLLDEKLWMDKQDEMLLKIANEDDLEVVHVLTDFLSRI